jgi:hypothetical protein
MKNPSTWEGKGFSLSAICPPADICCGLEYITTAPPVQMGGVLFVPWHQLDRMTPQRPDYPPAIEG